MMTRPEFRHFCEALLAQGRAVLDMETGIVSYIEDAVYKVVAVQARLAVFRAGDLFRLSDTYCRDVVRSGRSVALSQVDGVPGLQRHPLYMPMALEAYIAAPIIIGDSIWGTVNYTSMLVHKRPFSDDDIALVERQAADVAAVLKENVALQRRVI